MLKRFISYYRPHRRLFILDMLASLAVSLVGILYPIITRLMLNDLIPEKRYRTIILCGAGLLLLYIVRMLLNYFIQFYGHVMGVRMQAQMRSDMFRHLERLPYSFYDNHETGKIMSRMTNDLQDISELAHHGPENLITSTVSVIVSFTYLCTINWKLTLTIFICIPFLLAAAQKNAGGVQAEPDLDCADQRRAGKQYFRHPRDQGVHQSGKGRGKIRGGEPLLYQGALRSIPRHGTVPLYNLLYHRCV